jgi:hypothetical protein
VISNLVSSGFQSASDRKLKLQQLVNEQTLAAASLKSIILRPEPIAEFAISIEAAVVEALSKPELMRSRLLRAQKTSAYSDPSLPASQLVSRIT